MTTPNKKPCSNPKCQSGIIYTESPIGRGLEQCPNCHGTGIDPTQETNLDTVPRSSDPTSLEEGSAEYSNKAGQGTVLHTNLAERPVSSGVDGHATTGISNAGKGASGHPIEADWKPAEVAPAAKAGPSDNPSPISCHSRSQARPAHELSKPNTKHALPEGFKTDWNESWCSICGKGNPCVGHTDSQPVPNPKEVMPHDDQRGNSRSTETADSRSKVSPEVPSSGQAGIAPMTPGQACREKAIGMALLPFPLTEWGAMRTSAKKRWEAMAQAAIDADPVRKQLVEALKRVQVLCGIWSSPWIPKQGRRQIEEIVAAVLAAAEPKEKP